MMSLARVNFRRGTFGVCRLKPAAAPPAFGRGKLLPEGNAPWLSKLVFQWIVPFLDVGFPRPLEKDDLWELPQAQLTASTTDAAETHFYSRCEPEKRPRFMQGKRTESDDLGLSLSSTKEDTNALEKATEPHYPKPPNFPWHRKKAKRKPTYDSSLFPALHRTFRLRIWIAGILQLCGDTLKMTTPLVTKVLLTWLTKSYVYHHLTDEQKASGQFAKLQGIGFGIGLAIALFAMQEVASLMTNHYFMTTQATGILVRTGIIGNIFRKYLRISGRARLEHSVGQIMTMISTDATMLGLTYQSHIPICSFVFIPDAPYLPYIVSIATDLI
ncbi:hypothetical protein B0H34DRAFT_181181 [Crassisporium funariophilum]|nr:hypothetical protein B0H34DRAFT_181181 [Crassisporium funariophilum]